MSSNCLRKFTYSPPSPFAIRLSPFALSPFTLRPSPFAIRPSPLAPSPFAIRHFASKTASHLQAAE